MHTRHPPLCYHSGPMFSFSFFVFFHSFISSLLPSYLPAIPLSFLPFLPPSFLLILLCGQLATCVCVEGLLLDLCLGIPPGTSWNKEPHAVPGIKLESIMCKAMSLPLYDLLCPKPYFFQLILLVTLS